MKTLYLDMDQVVADFNGYVEGFLGKRSMKDRWPMEDWNRIVTNPRLYQDLPKTPEADDLVEYCRSICKHNGWQLLFLTAIPKGNDVPWAFYDKVMWAQKYYPDIPVMFGPYSVDKQVHCRTDDILIDDRTNNCNEWRHNGGIAIQHLGDLTCTIEKLNEL